MMNSNATLVQRINAQKKKIKETSYLPLLFFWRKLLGGLQYPLVLPAWHLRSCRAFCLPVQVTSTPRFLPLVGLKLLFQINFLSLDFFFILNLVAT